jgi:hypothetical protein
MLMAGKPYGETPADNRPWTDGRPRCVMMRCTDDRR